MGTTVLAILLPLSLNKRLLYFGKMQFDVTVFLEICCLGHQKDDRV